MRNMLMMWPKGNVCVYSVFLTSPMIEKATIWVNLCRVLKIGLGGGLGTELGGRMISRPLGGISRRLIGQAARWDQLRVVNYVILQIYGVKCGGNILLGL